MYLLPFSWQILAGGASAAITRKWLI